MSKKYSCPIILESLEMNLTYITLPDKFRDFFDKWNQIG